MTDTTPAAPEPPPSPKPKRGWQKLTPFIVIAVGVIAMVRGGTQLYDAFVPHLPSCTSDVANTTLRDIYKKKNVELASLTDMKTLTDTSSEKTCQAEATTASEAATIFYSISWQGRAALIKITRVDSHPSKK